MPSFLGWLFPVFGRSAQRTDNGSQAARATRDLARQVAQMQSSLDRVASEVSSLVNLMSERGLDVHVENVYIDEVILDELNFNIDDIGVTDLGGALSIGINYGGRVVRPVRPSPQPTPRGDGKSSMNKGKTPPADQPRVGPQPDPGIAAKRLTGAPAGSEPPRVNIRFRQI